MNRNAQVPALFVENFDYENMRPDFINGVLTSDLLGKTFRCTVVGEKGSIPAIVPRAQPWAAQVGDLASYAHIRYVDETSSLARSFSLRLQQIRTFSLVVPARPG